MTACPSLNPFPWVWIPAPWIPLSRSEPLPLIPNLWWLPAPVWIPSPESESLPPWIPLSRSEPLPLIPNLWWLPAPVWIPSLESESLFLSLNPTSVSPSHLQPPPPTPPPSWWSLSQTPVCDNPSLIRFVSTHVDVQPQFPADGVSLRGTWIRSDTTLTMSHAVTPNCHHVTPTSSHLLSLHRVSLLPPSLLLTSPCHIGSDPPGNLNTMGDQWVTEGRFAWSRWRGTPFELHTHQSLYIVAHGLYSR